MRNLLLLALLLYDVVSGTRTNNYDYDENFGNKRQSFDDRRSWRKKALQKSLDPDHSDWDDRRKYENYNSRRYSNNIEVKGSEGIDKQRDVDFTSSIYKNERKYYDDFNKIKTLSHVRSLELDHGTSYLEKDEANKPSIMNCQRQYERFEACFAGCAAVSCDNPRERLRPCYPFCEPGCVCVQPYVRDDRTHKCVLPEDCTKGLKGIPDLGEEI